MFVSDETIRAVDEFSYAIRVWATSRLGVITGQPDDRISLTPSPLHPARLLLFYASTYSERARTCNRCNRYDIGDKQSVFTWRNPF